MQRTQWTDRTFKFDIPAGWLPDILERLYGTPVRLLHMTAGLTEEQAAQQLNGKWSIKENIGHLTDLEELQNGRIDDFIARRDTLRAADMSNARTYSANYNERPLGEVLEEFAGQRKQYIARLKQLDDETAMFLSLHPRLQEMVRPVDMAFFTAEHDDHHLAAIRQILDVI